MSLSLRPAPADLLSLLWSSCLVCVTDWLHKLHLDSAHGFCLACGRCRCSISLIWAGFVCSGEHFGQGRFWNLVPDSP